MRASLIVAAGGSGSRFRKTLRDPRPSSIPSKLFFPLQGKTILERTLSAFQDFPEITETLVAVPKGVEPAVKDMIQRNCWDRIKILQGGNTRAESVWKAFRKTDTRNPWILVHDGARPFVSAEAMK